MSWSVCHMDGVWKLLFVFIDNVSFYCISDWEEIKFGRVLIWKIFCFGFYLLYTLKKHEHDEIHWRLAKFQVTALFCMLLYIL